MGLFSRKSGRRDESSEKDEEVEVDEVESVDAVDTPVDDEDLAEVEVEVEVDEADGDDDADGDGDSDSGVLLVKPDAPDDGDDDDSSAEGEDDEAPAEDEDPDGEGAEQGELTGQIEFELAEWGTRERQMIDAELSSLRIRRAWEASTLVVAASDAEVVDDLIDIIEERIALDLPSDVTPVIYEVGDWPAGLEDRFVDALIEKRIAHMRGYREITVGIDDEEQVDGLVEEITAAWEDEQLTDDDLNAPDAQQVLSELFVAADRLLHDPDDKAATVRFDDAAQVALDMAVPFGFDDADWGEIVDLTEALQALLQDADSSDEQVVEAATALRTHLRPIV